MDGSSCLGANSFPAEDQQEEQLAFLLTPLKVEGGSLQVAPENNLERQPLRRPFNTPIEI